MTLALYMDHHVPRAITIGLRLRGVDVLTAFEDGAHRLPDPQLLDRAAELARVLFTSDDDLLAEAAKRQMNEQSFYGIIYAHHGQVSIGACVHDLEVVAKAGDPSDMINYVLFLPL